MNPKGMISLFAGGVLFGSAGISLLTSKDFKKAYTHCTAAVLRCKDAVVNTGVTLKDNCQDIYADASDINEKRYEAEELKKLEAAKAIVEAYEAKNGAAEAPVEAPAEA